MPIFILGLFFIFYFSILALKPGIFFALLLATMLTLLGALIFDRLGTSRIKYWLSYKVNVLSGTIRFQLEGLSNLRIWTLVILHLALFIFLSWALRQPMELVLAITLLFLYVLSVLSLSILFLAKLPFIGVICSSPALKLSIYTIPAFVLFLSRGYAASWVGAIFEINPSNIPFAYTAATVFVASLALMIVLLGMAFIFETLILLPAMLPDKAVGSGWRRIGLITLVGISFCACMASYFALERLPSNSLGRLFIMAVAYRFDSIPARFCALNDEEAKAAQGDSPRLVAVSILPNQQKAVLYRSSEPVLDFIVIRGFTQEQSELRKLRAIRTVECFRSDLAPINPEANKKER